jgi:signal transduction histidine kinase
MSLKKKLFFFIAGLGVVFSLLFLFFNHLTIRHSENEQKAIFARKIASRLSRLFANEGNRVETLCCDWACWDAMNSYSSAPSKEFERDALPDGVAAGSGLSLLLIIDKGKQVIFHQGFDQQSGRAATFTLRDPLPTPLWKDLVRSFSLPRVDRFISESEFGPLLVISAPILNSEGQGPMNGRVVMGRLVDDTLTQRLGASMQEETSLMPPAVLQRHLEPDAWRELSKNDFYLSESGRHMNVYTLFRSKTGKAAFAIRVDADKTMFDLQEEAVRSFLFVLLTSTLLTGALFYQLIDRLLLRRLKTISQKTKHITSSKDLSIRIQDERHDEIAQLGRDVNKMLERLENDNVRHQEMERRLIINEKLVATGRLAANIAHEINNPLFAISNSLAVIKKQIKNPSGDIAELLPLAEKEIKRVRKITRKLLDYGKINLETFRESDVNAILQTACAVLKLSRGSRSTAVTRSRTNAPLPIFCNPDSLQQVFMNLILNASEAMGGRGEITIDSRIRGDSYEIRLRDTGPGFPSEIKKKIFEPFNTSKGTKGAGLGLYIAYHIVKRHGGSMALAEPQQGGSEMIVTLPRGKKILHE